jgi:hypothetical protein
MMIGSSAQFQKETAKTLGADAHPSPAGRATARKEKNVSKNS